MAACHRSPVHPILFEIGSYQVPAYGIALALAFAVGICIAQRRARARGLDEERLLDAGMIALVSSIVGARLLWVVTHLDTFRAPGASWLDAINPFQSGGFGVAGLSMLGGVLLATVSVLAYVRWRRMPLLPYADVMAPSVALGEGVTRIGCFLNGCCHGVVCELPWGVRFPADSAVSGLFGGAAVHPTQLYASASGFLLFGLLSWLLARRAFDGAVFFAFLVGVGVQRLVIDVFRHHDVSTVWLQLGELPFTSNDALSLVLVAAGLVGLALRHHLTRSGSHAIAA